MFLLFSFWSLNLFADHIVATEITYEYKGNNKYDFTLKLYRDCAGIPVSDIESMTVYDDEHDSVFLESFTLQQEDGTGKELKLYCPTITTTCGMVGAQYPGIQEYVYKGFVFLSPNISKLFRVEWASCCRNNLINTATAIEIGETAVINLKDGYKNSSPKFLNKAAPYVCLNEQYCFSQGSYEVDGDSLVFELIDPVGIVYYAGYSKDHPISSSTPVTFDTKTGDICFKPTNLEVTVFAFKVSEYRKGKFVGSVSRDMQVIVTPCTNNLPYLKGIDGNGNYAVTVCGGNNVCFNIPSFDADNNQNLTLEWNAGIPNATFNPGSGSRPTGKFCWATKTSDSRDEPYLFSVTVYDNNCPLLGYQTYTFSVKVDNGVDFSLGNDIDACVGDVVTLVPIIKSGIVQSLKWQDNSTSNTLNVQSTGLYWVEVMTVSGCVIKDEINVTFHALPTVKIVGDTITCLGEKISVQASGAVTYQWGPQSFTTARGEFLNILVNQNHILTLKGIDEYGCVAYDQKNLIILPRQNHTISNDTILCKGQTANLNVAPATGSILWTYTEPLSANNAFSAIATPKKSSYYKAKVSMLGFCNWTDSVLVTVNEDLVADFNVKPNLMNISNPRAVINDLSKGKVQKRIWDFGDNEGDIFNKNPIHTYADTGSYDIKLIIFDNAGCSDTVVKPARVDFYTLYLPNAFTPNDNNENETFRAYGYNISSYHIQIFNRWGEMIFQTSNIAEGWNGRRNNNEQMSPIDTYVYNVEVSFFDKPSETTHLRGIVTLVK